MHSFGQALQSLVGDPHSVPNESAHSHREAAVTNEGIKSSGTRQTGEGLGRPGVGE